MVAFHAVAALPIFVLFGLLVGLKVKPHWCAIAGAMTAAFVAVVFFKMPVILAVMSFGYGVAFGLLKIAWIVLAAVFLYDISVATGQFEIMKESVAGITAGPAPAGAAGGILLWRVHRRGSRIRSSRRHRGGLHDWPGLPAVSRRGAEPDRQHRAGGLGQRRDSYPHPGRGLRFAGIGLERNHRAILPITALIVPFWLVRTLVSWRETFEVFPAILVVGISFAVTRFSGRTTWTAAWWTSWAEVISIVATVAFLKFWKPKKIWRFDYDEKKPAAPPAEGIADASGGEWTAEDFAENLAARSYPFGKVLKAWMPFAILSIAVLLWGLPKVKLALNQATTPAFKVVQPDGKVRPGPPGWDVPYLHNAVYRAAPVVDKPVPEAARYDFNWLSATGTGCFIAAIISGLLLGLSPVQLVKTFWHTLLRMRLAVIAISFMLGLGFVTRYSGLDAVLGLAFTRTGWAYPFFGTFLGWLGVALTGSDTSSNALFGSLQRITSQQLGIDPVLMCAANSAGGVMGKMVDAQSITIATAATNQVGNEGVIFRFVVWHSVALGGIVGIIVMLYAYVFPHLVPHGLTFVK